ncbi:MlaC/ttg2D family ABC transporter substrate-binding protein [Candidatus Methylobacter oryzae]|uniref:ABC transporter substrate-binding protein n=1 Tax=Candidatus Methylobacter oryzae TaxID=2497749 RepID=A0ABY3C910_9GAMM|nr:ABC transporter substrate-binding protein [Candidatus Methylobacter oryzae]TRW93200.1 ABC transporter substrate-binding protein [Candidatus Methylobacter oryzae]
MRNQTKHYVLKIFFALLLGLMAVGQSIADDLQPPQQIIQSVSNQLQKKLQDKAFTKNFAQVVEFVDGVISLHTDFGKIAPLVLGKYWKTATTEEQQRFKREFQTLIIRTYSRAFVEYNDWTIRFVPLEMSNDVTKIVVKTEVLQPGLQPVSVNYRMFLNQGDWKVYDIVIEGVSLVTNYRSTFNEQIQTKGSLSAVIDDLAKRNAEALSAKGS